MVNIDKIKKICSNLTFKAILKVMLFKIIMLSVLFFIFFSPSQRLHVDDNVVANNYFATK